ncbi:MAG: hypothetical protein OFPII_30420 [Osedax symbiont Rs1]|nr:MAG: hypothetical protein OFPII_30420 [Osedax symbiont Rs1]
MSYIIRQGDPTTTGGSVTQGHGLFETFGKPTTLEGMIATCPACKKGSGPIKPVSKRSCDVEGKVVIIQGDIVQCGCSPGANTVIATQFEATATA